MSHDFSLNGVTCSKLISKNDCHAHFNALLLSTVEGRQWKQWNKNPICWKCGFNLEEHLLSRYHRSLTEYLRPSLVFTGITTSYSNSFDSNNILIQTESEVFVLLADAVIFWIVLE